MKNKLNILKVVIILVLEFLTIKETLKIISISAKVDSSGTAISIPISDTNVEDGDIICSYLEGNKKCYQEYDTSIYGVVNDNPALSIKDFSYDTSKLVLSLGITTVKVSSVNGDIKEGDFITSSTKPGVGQKATKNGYVIGKALEDYKSTDANAVGKIQVALKPQFVNELSSSSGNLLQFMKKGLNVPFYEPLNALRYLLSALMVVISFTLGMIYFGRSSKAGIEAIGRNPLARKVIHFTIITNIVLTIVIVLVGLAIAYLILVL